MGKKKGALDVSINSIVVIVFAVTMLGLGLAFIKGYFEKAKGTIDLDGVTQVPDATINIPISTSSDTFTLEKGKISTFKIKFYNNYQNGDIAFALGNCVVEGSPPAGGSSYFTLTSSPQNVNVGYSKEFTVKLTTVQGTFSTEYICNLQATQSGQLIEEKQMTFRVK